MLFTRSSVMQCKGSFTHALYNDVSGFISISVESVDYSISVERLKSELHSVSAFGLCFKSSQF